MHPVHKRCFLFSSPTLNIKSCVQYLLSNLYFQPNDSPSKTMKKCFLFHLKSSFHFQDIQVFIFWSSLLFLPINHCIRRCLKINHKVYDVINCLNKKLQNSFIWYLGKEKSYDIEILSIDRVLNEEHFYGKIMQKMCTKSESQTPF